MSFEILIIFMRINSSFIDISFNDLFQFAKNYFIIIKKQKGYTSVLQQCQVIIAFAHNLLRFDYLVVHTSTAHRE